MRVNMIKILMSLCESTAEHLMEGKTLLKEGERVSKVSPDAERNQHK